MSQVVSCFRSLNMEKNLDPQLGKQSITQQISGLLLPIFIVMGVMVAVFSVMLLSINYRYEDAMQSAVIAADFNKEFKIYCGASNQQLGQYDEKGNLDKYIDKSQIDYERN